MSVDRYLRKAPEFRERRRPAAEADAVHAELGGVAPGSGAPKRPERDAR